MNINRSIYKEYTSLIYMVKKFKEVTQKLNGFSCNCKKCNKGVYVIRW